MIITQTPLRISFVGGGTDFPEFYQNFGGAVLSTAIDKYVFVIVKERFDDMIYLNWMKKEIVESVDELEHELVRETMKKTGVMQGVEITTLSDIPSEGSGLGSSSSITVGLLQALYLHRGISKDAESLAREACEIELSQLKKPVGKQDQYIAAYGGFRHISFHQNGDVSVTSPRIKADVLERLGLQLMLYYTGKTRKSADILKDQRSHIEDSLGILRKMRDQTYDVLHALEAGNVDFLGDALDYGWLLKKKLAGNITSDEIDEMYKKAKKAGAIGGKIAGAGGGGFMLLYVPLEKQTILRQALSGYRELQFRLEKDGSKAIFNIRR